MKTKYIPRGEKVQSIWQ